MATRSGRHFPKGHPQPWCSIAVDGSSSPDSCRSRRMQMMAGLAE